MDNQQALIKAIEKKDLETIKELVDGGADLNKPFTPIHTTPFQYAMVFFKDLKSVETLIKLGGNVNSTNDHLETPLMIAVNLDGPVRKCDPRLPALFVEYGVETLDAQNQWGNTALLNVLLAGNIKSHKDLIECFVKYGADIFKKRNRRGLSAWDVIWDSVIDKE